MATYKAFLVAAASLAAIALVAASASAQPAEPAEEGDESTIMVEPPAGEPVEEPAEEPVAEPEPPPPPVEPEADIVVVEELEQDEAAPETGREEQAGISLVEAGWGRVKLGGVLQAQFNAPDLGNELDSRDAEFNIERMRLILTGGFLDDRIEYLVQGDMVNLAGFLLDARVSLKFLKGLELRFGRFIPDFTFYMPRHVGRLMAIDYPLVTEKFAPWRQVGLELLFCHEYFDIIAGIFNGMRFLPGTSYMVGGEVKTVSSPELMEGYMTATTWNLTDDNMGKDFLFKLMARPVRGLSIGGYVWYGMPRYSWYDVARVDVIREDANLVHFGVEARYLHEKFSVLAEYAMRRLYYPGGSADVELNPVDPDPLVSHGGYFHAGYRFLDMLEVMLRGDYYDEDLEDDDLGQQIWGTLGFNYFLDDVHSRMTLEYILKAVQEENGSGDHLLDHGLYFQLSLVI